MTENRPANAGGVEPSDGPGESILDAVDQAFEPREATYRPPAAPPPATSATPTREATALFRPRPATSARYGRSPSLFSASVAERRRRLDQLAASGLGAGQIEAVARALTADPEVDIRLSAARLLADAARRVPLSLVARALGDPSDRVRSEAVRLAAAHGPEAMPLLLPISTDRRWAATQQVALSVLPDLVRAAGGLPEAAALTFLASVGSLDPPPLAAERDGLESVARAIEPGRMVRALREGDALRLGAARLALLTRTPQALRALAALADDPLPEVGALAANASRLLRGAQAPGEPVADRAGNPDGARGDAPDVERAVIASLARALGDPARPVREQAETALRRIPITLLAAWVEDAVVAGGPQAEAAAMVAGAVGIGAAAPALFERAAALPAEARGPFLSALMALRLEPAEFARMASEVPAAFRQAAVRLAWQVGGRGIVPHLAPLLADSAGAVRMAVIEVLAESRDPSALTLAGQRLEKDASAAVRATAVHALAAADDATRRSALTQALSDPDPDVRATAVEALPDGSPAMVEALLSALRDEDERVWRAALSHLASVPDTELSMLWTALGAIPLAKRDALIEAIERVGPSRLTELAVRNVRSLSPDDRALSVEVAARAGTPEATALVVAALEDPHPLVRRTAALSMSSLRSAGAVPALSRSLSDPQAEVRVEAVRALGLIDDDTVPDRLIDALDDPEVRVREMAADALARWHSPVVARRLAAALGSPDLRRPAGEVLERMGRVAVEALAEVAEGHLREAAQAAGTLLDRIVGSEPFVAELSSVDPEHRMRAVQVLGSIGGPVACEALMGALPDPDIQVRSRAAVLLGDLGYLPAVKHLRRMFLTDPVAEAAAAAESSLRALGAVPPPGDDLRIVEDVTEDQEPSPD